MQRSRPLDFLRAFAVLLVLGRHMAWPCPIEVNRALHWATAAWATCGWIGVDLFFVLSGFLVSGLLFQEYQKHGTIRPGRFLIRRGFKIYPAFWALVLITVVADLRKGWPNIGDILSELLFVQNYRLVPLGHTWSLAVEEHFYLLLVCLLYFLAKAKSRHASHNNPFQILPWTFVAVAVICLALRYWTLLVVPYGPDTESVAKHLFPTHLRIDSLFFGVLISYYYNYYPEKFISFVRTKRWWFCIAGALLFSTAAFWEVTKTGWISVYGFSMYYIASGLILTGAVMLQFPRSRLLQSIEYIGTHSYSIYLWHVPANRAARWLFRNSSQEGYDWFAYMGSYLAAALLIGIFFSIAIEFPVLKLRNRWFPSRSESSKPQKTISPSMPVLK